MQQFRLDRTTFTAQRMSDIKKQRHYWLTQPASARLEAAWYLVCAAYGLEYTANHRLDRSVFSMRKMSL